MEARTSSLQKQLSTGEELYRASQWKLIFWKLRQHKLAVAGGIILLILYLAAILASFIAPYDPQQRSEFLYLEPQRIHFFAPDRPGIHPFVYGLSRSRDPESLALVFTELPDERHYLRFFARGSEYKLLGLFKVNIHLFGMAEEGRQVFLLGTDNLGRDVFSRAVRAASVSLSVGLVGVALSFLLGVLLGGISGYYGGLADKIIQQIVTFLSSLPTIPIWMGLSAALPAEWPPLRVYFGLTVILSFVGWTGLARVVRGRMLQLREEAFVTAARLAGTKSTKIIFWHLLPSCMSYLIVNITLAVPSMILGETALSFLGLGLKEPVVSWGVLLQQAQNIRTVALYPWLMTPALLVVVTSLAFNFLGDGLRDAADPYA
jgi:peptide/nickel transport system permease protein